MGVLWRTIFSHTPDEAKSGGLVKACVQEKKLFCSREIEFFMRNNPDCVDSMWQETTVEQFKPYLA